MSALVVVLVWSVVGVCAALTDRHDRSAVWVLAGALLGPLWIAIRNDRRVADSLTLDRVRVSRLAPDRRLTAERDWTGA
jgi:hypothetical protein